MNDLQSAINAFVAICAVTALRRLIEIDDEMTRTSQHEPNPFDEFAARCDLSPAEVYVVCAVVADVCESICTEEIDLQTARMKLEMARLDEDKQFAYAQCVLLDGASVDELLLFMLGHASNKVRIAMQKCTQCRRRVAMSRDWRQGPDLGHGAWHNVRCKHCASRYDVFVETAKHGVLLN